MLPAVNKHGRWKGSHVPTQQGASNVQSSGNQGTVQLGSNVATAGHIIPSPFTVSPPHAVKVFVIFTPEQKVCTAVRKHSYPLFLCSSFSLGRPAAYPHTVTQRYAPWHGKPSNTCIVYLVRAAVVIVRNNLAYRLNRFFFFFPLTAVSTNGKRGQFRQ